MNKYKYLITYVVTLFLFYGFSDLSLYSQNIREGIVGYWPLNCDFADSSSVGNNINALPIGSPLCIEGKLNEAIKLDGNNDYLQIDRSNSLDLVSDKGFSWSIWFKLNDIITSREARAEDILISYANPELKTDIILGFGSVSSPADELAFIVDGPGGTGGSAFILGKDLSYKPEDGYEADKWYHAVGTMDYDNKIVALYIDGALVESYDNHKTEPMEEEMGFFFGGFVDGASDNILFNGSLDEIRIYERVLSQDEVLILYSARPEQLSVDTNLVDFDNILCETSKTITVPIFNEGPSKFLIADFEFTGNNNFSVYSDGDTTLEDQEIFNLELVFNSNVSGTFYDTLYINNNNFIQATILYLQAIKDVQINVDEDIQFSELVICDMDSPGQLSLSASITIDNINVAEGLILDKISFSSNSFSYVDNEPDYLIMDSKTYEIVFTPTDTMSFDEVAVVSFANCDVSKTINISALSTSIGKEFLGQIDFGEIENSVDSIIIYNYNNVGTAEFEILSISEPEPPFYFDNFSSTIYKSYLPNEKLEFNIRFTPTGEEHSSSFTIRSKDVCDEYIDTVYLEGIGKYRAYFDIVLQNIEGSTGDSITFPLRIQNPVNFDKAGLSDMKIEVEYNKTIFYSDRYRDEKSSELDKATMNFEIPITPENEEQSAILLEGIITLGNKELDSITIKSIEFDSGIFTANIINGSLKVNDICLEGGKRLFSADEFLFLGEAIPNPTSEQLHLSISLLEKGRTKLYLIDPFGNQKAMFFDEELDVGVYDFTFDLTNIPTGPYIYVLETPTQIRSKKLQILK